MNTTFQAGALTARPGVMRIMKGLRAQARHAETLRRWIESDAVLTIRALRGANRLQPAAASPVVSVCQAVRRLGMDAVVRLACDDAAEADGFAEPSHPLDAAVWRHNLAAAIVAETMQPRAHGPVSEAARTAALLHDLGKVVIVQSYRGQERSLRDWQTEIRVWDENHTHIGGAAACAWGLPAQLAYVILHHHDRQKDLDDLMSLTVAADAIAHDAEEAEPPALDERQRLAMRRWGLSPVMIRKIRNQVRARLRETEEEISRWD